MNVLLLLLAILAGPSKPTCAVDVQPRLDVAPVRYVRTKATIEDRSGGLLSLVDEVGAWASSVIQPGAITSWIEWKDLGLDTGMYEVVLQTGHGCVARQRIEVR